MGFYRGIIPSMFGVLQSSIHFMFYEQLKYQIQIKNERYMNSFETIMITIIAKSGSVILTYPYQVVRTRLHHVNGESTHIIPILNKIMQLSIVLFISFT